MELRGTQFAGGDVMDNIPARAPYQGLMQIFDYNRPFYLRTAAGVMAAVYVSMYQPLALRVLILAAVGLAVVWTCSSLLVSHYVYDRSGLYRLSWLPGCLSRRPERWINLHAGVDESSLAMHSLFPGSEGQTIDIYDPCKMTAPSIKRARRVSGVSLLPAHPQTLPALDGGFDTAFLIFAAHELRDHQDRVRLFQEIARVLRIGGELVLVEHLRDWANFLAFGPGFLHFFSKRCWETATGSAGLTIRLRATVTPFVHVFVLQRQR